eukprot:1713938-Amphidinium_carterae.1
MCKRLASVCEQLLPYKSEGIERMHTFTKIQIVAYAIGWLMRSRCGFGRVVYPWLRAGCPCNIMLD